MRRLISLAILAAAAVLGSCSKQAPAPNADDGGRARPALDLAGDPGINRNEAPKIPDVPLLKAAEPTPQERYDAALLEALCLMAERKYNQALLSLETARSIQDTEQVRLEIDKIKASIAQQEAAEKTARDIQAVLADGKADEAAKLGTAALQQFGATDAADDLAKLKRQADAVAVAPVDDTAVRRARFQQEAESAYRDKNLRAAAIAYEQLLQLGEDVEARRRCDEVRDALTRYDDARARAAQLRRDPGNLEDALAAYQEAQKAWDTPQIRLDLDECRLALQKRRDRLSVADFEVRGDIGLPLAGRTVAEELLPAFKSRFDLVERNQLGRVLDELKLEATALADSPEGRSQVGQLAKLRFLVVGSITPLNGITIHARLVDVRTGLIVQTARVSAPTIDGLMPRLPMLGQLLMMTDEQKMAFEQAQLAAATEIRAVDVAAPLPPPPPLPADNVSPPPPLIVYTPRPPATGGLTIEFFSTLPPVGFVPPPPVAEVAVVREDPYRRRMLSLSLELGDNLFRRGRYREAQRHFSLALNLTDDRREIDLRIERCRPYVPPPPPPPVVVIAPPPPPPVVVVQPPPLVVVTPPVPVVVIAPPPPPRPRLVVFNFLVTSDPGLVPPAVGDWAADQFGSYFGTGYEVVERGEMCWYMGRLGITMRDVLADPFARRSLAQALNVRFFVFGTIQQTASFNVTTHLIDADTGARQGTGTIHVQDHNELKLRMHELAKQTGAPKDEQARLAQAGKESEKVLNQARQLQKEGKNAQAAEVARTALKTDPNNVALKTLLQQNEDQARKATEDEARKRDAAARLAEAEAARKRQADLAKQAEAARVKAEQDAKARTDAVRREQEAQKQKAQDRLLAEGQTALSKGDYTQAAQAFQSAVALKPSDAGFQGLAQARAKAQEAERKHAADEQAKRDAEAKRQRDAALAKVEEEKRRRDADETAKRKAQEAHDQAAYDKLVAGAKQSLAKEQYDAALGDLQSAKGLRKTDEVDKLIAQTQDAKTLAAAKKKGEQAHGEAERKLAEEKKARDQAEAEAKHKQETYLAALDKAQKALTAKRYDEAVTHYQEAGKLFRTDAVLTGQRQAEELRDHAKAQADAETRKRAEDEKRAAQVKKLLADGKTALDGRQFDAAIKAYREASTLSPGNVEVMTALSKAEHARDDFAAKNRQKLEDDRRLADFRKLLDSGKANLAAKKYEAAVVPLREAVKLKPADSEATAALKDAENRLAAVQADDAAAKKRQTEYQGLLQKGRDALQAKRLDEAVQTLTAATKLMPSDAASQDLLRQALKAQSDAKRTTDQAAADAAAQKQRKADYDRAVSAGQTALKNKNYQSAVTAYTEALRIMPGDKDATALLKQAEKLRDDSKTAQDAEAKRKAEEAKRRDDYARLMNAGRTALAGKNYDQAIQSFTAAATLMPGDQAAAAALKEAEKGKADVKAALDAEAKRKQEEAKRRDDFNRLMAAGQAAMAAKRYAEAAKDYADALKLQPGDPTATRALADANKAADAAKAPPPPPPPDPKAEYARQMGAGAALEKQGKYADAMAAYRAALKYVPGDAKATAGLKSAEYGLHLAEGQKALSAKRFPDATKEFEAALKLFPDSADAKALLKKAKDGKP
jgi:tetratricopeptide (TPR) repeat protein